MSSFPQFAILPTELRLQIWELAVPVPQFLELQHWTSNLGVQILTYKHRNPLFVACRESRAVAERLPLSADTLSHIQRVEPSPFRYRRSFKGAQMSFLAERDTLFFRSMDHSFENSLHVLANDCSWRFTKIQHIAIPLDLKTPVPSRASWILDLQRIRSVKSVTFMLGCAEKSWVGEPSIELRDLEQWFADGRKRTVMVAEHGCIDVAELGPLLSTIEWQNNGYMRKLQVRVVAWKRKG